MFWRHCHIAWPSGRSGFTITEVLIVVAILALLVAVLLGVSSFINTQKNTALTENCLDILDTALAEFHDITGHYPVDDWGDKDETGSRIDGANLTSPSDDPDSSELLYLQLNVLPQTRAIIAKLPDQLLVQPVDLSDNLITVELAGQSGDTPYLRQIVDAWGNALEYTRDLSDPDDVFPTIVSGGADGNLTNEEDNITNEN